MRRKQPNKRRINRPNIQPLGENKPVDKEKNKNEVEYMNIKRFAQKRARQDRQPRRKCGNHDGMDQNIGSIKMKIPPFQGKNNLDLYLELEQKVKLVFECDHYLEEKKVKLATIEFIDYVIVWQDQVILSLHRNLQRPIETYAEMKAIIRKCFMPRKYY